jgi:hypothetical protein
MRQIVALSCDPASADHTALESSGNKADCRAPQERIRGEPPAAGEKRRLGN